MEVLVIRCWELWKCGPAPVRCGDVAVWGCWGMQGLGILGGAEEPPLATLERPSRCWHSLAFSPALPWEQCLNLG